MANYITYATKVGIEPKTVHINQWWDDDANEIKAKHNANDDRITALETLTSTISWSNIQSIGDLDQVTPATGDLFLVERAGVKKYVTYDDLNTGGGSSSDHAELTNLDYASAGHTGFEKTLLFGVGLLRTPGSPDQIDLELSAIDHDQLKNYEADEHFKQADISITHDQVSDWDAEVANLRNVYALELAAGGSVQDRVNASTPGQNGWTYAGNGLNLEINHGFGRRVMDVKVWVNDAGVEQQLRGTVSDAGLITPDDDNLTVLSLATVAKPLKIYISFL